MRWVTAARHLAITTLAALAVAGGGVAAGRTTDDEPPTSAPDPVAAPLSLPDCEHAPGFVRVPGASGGKRGLDDIVYLDECNYGEASITVTP
jgi:hypothetical protein